MGELSQPPMAWRLSGNQVKLWRTEANISREELAEEAGYGPETIKSMEQGRRRPTQRLLEIADEMCGAKGKLVAVHPYLEPDRALVRTDEYMAIEAEAIAIDWYEVLLIPGLLQTEDYARVLMASHCPPVEDETVEVRVTGRLERQGLLEKTTTLFNFVIHEVALRGMVGGPEVMKRQLNHLAEMGKLRNVSIQVLPVGQGAIPGINGPFTLLEMSDHRRYCYGEGQVSSMLHADPDRVSVLMKRYATIRMHALNDVDSDQLMRRMAEEL
ncbi:helix-turn-helix transcriptional regulator [Streptomyces olivoreticuli]|uniref:helix-turn-helix domain-containing protein n=1 Tax=Streptomyces olivoreticuli TaxID=68246 RepID=UPI002657F60C|nr:helix-turn-helix transcriptional regulator [Streptomyces olivoreticuli]WKK21462.1 helix-turn-helix transcriptional regulator [Streptomyces olivoreticuli]